MRQQMRLYTVIAQWRGGGFRDDASLDARRPLAATITWPGSRSAGRCARRARQASRIRRCAIHGGECLAAFKTALLRDCHHAAYLEYNWNGSAVDMVFELNQVG